ncbi:MAG TPA: hypothetical protein PKY77_05625 [Phycisphaerae bacterium]|nr:hypothetical protein [Phycisphaerae bacterium]HRY69077.1 hypothetical protein [Phycisphaerae bacterium]HSA25948.1 hypothetical protein [Phycisphaerae bacterium]
MPSQRAVMLLLLMSPSVLTGTELGVKDTQFTLNGQPVFLLGISYYGGLDASDETVHRDLVRLRESGFNWIRVWATWHSGENNASAVDAEGKAREPYMARLKALVAKYDRAGLVVDVTLAPQQASPDGRKPGYLATFDAHRRAVQTITATLRPHRNWYLDLANERNIRDPRYVSFDDLVKLRAAARQADPALLVTASQGGDIDERELREYLLKVKVDFICPHRPRDAASPASTEETTRRYLARMRALGRVVPVNYQEPFRRGYADWQPRAEDFLADAQGARRGGAAAWCLHNGSQRQGGEPFRSFDLRKKALFEQLDEQERRAIEWLKAQVSSTRPR